MINPATMMKLMSAKNTFEQNHPKFVAFIKQVMLGGRLQEGTILEVTLVRPGEEPVTANLKITQSDLELFEELKNMAQQ